MGGLEKITMLREYFHKIGSGFIFIAILALFFGWPYLIPVINDNIYQKLPHKLREATNQQFVKAIEPLSRWCSHYSYVQDGKIRVVNYVRSEFPDLKPNPDSPIQKRWGMAKSYNACVISRMGRETSFNNFSEQYLSTLKEIETTISVTNIQNIKRVSIDDRDSSDGVRFSLLTKHAINDDGEQLDYGVSLACLEGAEVFSLRAEALFKDDERCEELQWISFKSFKPIAEACYERCEVFGILDQDEKLVSLQIKSNFNVEEEMKGFQFSLRSSLRDAIEETRRNFQTIVPKDKMEWERLTGLYPIEL